MIGPYEHKYCIAAEARIGFLWSAKETKKLKHNQTTDINWCNLANYNYNNNNIENMKKIILNMQKAQLHCTCMYVCMYVCTTTRLRKYKLKIYGYPILSIPGSIL